MAVPLDPDTFWRMDRATAQQCEVVVADPDARDPAAADLCLAEQFADDSDQRAFDPTSPTPPVEPFEPLVRQLIIED